MRNIITKEIVKLDKTLREQIEILEIEKAHIDQAVLKEKQRLIDAFQVELKQLIKRTVQEQESLFERIESEARLAFETRLQQMNEQFHSQKDAWVEHIFHAMIKGDLE